MPIRYYRDLVVWRRGIHLVLESYRIAGALPVSERFNLSEQIRRAAVSIPANIAEGHGRIHRGEYLHHLSIARGSLMELETHVYIVESLGLVSEAELAPVREVIREVRMLLDALIRALRRAPRPPTPDP